MFHLNNLIITKTDAKIIIIGTIKDTITSTFEMELIPIELKSIVFGLKMSPFNHDTTTNVFEYLKGVK